MLVDLVLVKIIHSGIRIRGQTPGATTVCVKSISLINFAKERQMAIYSEMEHGAGTKEEGLNAHLVHVGHKYMNHLSGNPYILVKVMFVDYLRHKRTHF